MEFHQRAIIQNKSQIEKDLAQYSKSIQKLGHSETFKIKKFVEKNKKKSEGESKINNLKENQI